MIKSEYHLTKMDCPSEENMIRIKLDGVKVVRKLEFNIENHNLDVTVAVLDPVGCSIINQNISGTNKDSEYGRVKVIETLLAPVTNLVEMITAKECDRFYQGKVEHPD